MKAEVNSEFDLPNIRSGPNTCCIELHLKLAAENQLRTCHTCAPVAILTDKWEIFRLFAFDEKLQTIRRISNMPEVANIRMSWNLNFVTSLSSSSYVLFVHCSSCRLKAWTHQYSMFSIDFVTLHTDVHLAANGACSWVQPRGVGGVQTPKISLFQSNNLPNYNLLIQSKFPIIVFFFNYLTLRINPIRF